MPKNQPGTPTHVRLLRGTHYKLHSHSHYKYILLRNVTIRNKRFKNWPAGGFPNPNPVLNINPNARSITVCTNYAWDGASGPSIDTPNTMCASLIHDALYQAIRECRKNYGCNLRKSADKILHDILKADGMFWLRRRAWYCLVRFFGKSAAEC